MLLHNGLGCGIIFARASDSVLYLFEDCKSVKNRATVSREHLKEARRRTFDSEFAEYMRISAYHRSGKPVRSSADGDAPPDADGDAPPDVPAADAISSERRSARVVPKVG